MPPGVKPSLEFLHNLRNIPQTLFVSDHMDMLTETVLGISYKPGWTFGLDHTAGRDTLVIGAFVQHSATLDYVYFDIKRLIPSVAKRDRASFLSWVEDMLAEAEIHEMREFFRFRGKLYDSPHEAV